MNNSSSNPPKVNQFQSFFNVSLTLARAGYVIRRGVITYKSNNSTREVTRLIVRAGGDQ